MINLNTLYTFSAPKVTCTSCTDVQVNQKCIMDYLYEKAGVKYWEISCWENRWTKMADQLSVKTQSLRLSYVHKWLFFPYQLLLLMLSEKVELIKWWCNWAAPPPNRRMLQLHSIICNLAKQGQGTKTPQLLKERIPLLHRHSFYL